MSEEKRVLELDQYEHRAVVNIINEKRTNMINENEDNDLMSPVARTAIVVSGEKVGYMGLVHPAIMKKLDTKKKVAVLEVNYNKLMKFDKEDKAYKKVSKYQTVDIDFNFLVPNSMNYASVQEVISAFRCKFNPVYKLKDVYENKELFDGFKSMTFGFSICSNDHTLSANEIENFRSRFVSHMKQNGMELR